LKVHLHHFSKITSHDDGRSGSVPLIKVADPDPDSIGSVDTDSESGSGSRRAKITHKSRKNFIVQVLKCWIASFEISRLLL
jgi:hypothetical protein